MAYIQKLQFNPAKMGKKAGWCLQNCRLGFGIQKGTFASAKLDMESQRRNGTLHQGVPPKDISCPIYCDTKATAEHVVVWHKGAVYEDGRLRSRGVGGLAMFGWGELCDGVRVVSVSSAPVSGFLPSRGYWRYGDNDARVGALCSFYAESFYGYFCKDKKSAHNVLDGNYFGNNCLKWTKEFQRRTKLEADGNVGPITYNKLKEFGFKG